jgi:hypothetical protein
VLQCSGVVMTVISAPELTGGGSRLLISIVASQDSAMRTTVGGSYGYATDLSRLGFSAIRFGVGL